MTTEAERRARERVEWLAALWELIAGKRSTCANPQLLTLLRYTSALSSTHPAVAEVRRLRRSQSRDRLIKAVVRAAYGGADEHPRLCETLDAFGEEAPALLGAGPHELVRQARCDVQDRADEIAGLLDPAANLAEVTGELLPLRVVLAPSVFLPLPQAGRHGALVETPDGWVVHLHFGFPLSEDPGQCSIDRPWILGGAWHYAIHLYLERHWPPIAERLVSCSELAEAVPRVLSLDSATEPAGKEAWVRKLRHHLNVAFKALLSRRIGVADSVHRAFAMASGLVLFPWFDQWLQDSGAEGEDLADHIATLPEALSAQRSCWEDLAHSGTAAPRTVNLALISPSVQQGSLVVPDEWAEEIATEAVAGWRELLPLPLFRYSDWVRNRSADTHPIIAFGDTESNPLVGRVLRQRDLSLETVDAEDPAIIALSSPGFEDAPWCIAVAVHGPETASRLRMEVALGQTCSYILLDGDSVIGGERILIDRADTVSATFVDNREAQSIK